jgi:hypothetical protein
MMTIGVRIAGVLLVAAGLLAILLALLSPTSPAGLTLETGAVLLVGGVAALGLSGVIVAVDNLRAFIAGEDQPAAEPLEETRYPAKPANPLAPSASGAKPSSQLHNHVQRFEPSIGKVMEMSKVPEDHGSIIKENTRSSVDRVADETRDFGSGSIVEPEIISEEELYVVEERTIAGKPARILSDGTVEAETDEGWMRFENVEHLQEYLDAMRSPRG